MEITSNMMSQETYLMHMAHENIEFRLPELESVCELIGRPKCVENHTYSMESPMFSCSLAGDELAKRIAERCFLLKSISRLFYQERTLEKLLDQITASSLPMVIDTSDTFKITVYSFGKTISQNEKIQKIDKLIGALGFPDQMKVCMNNDLVKHRFFYVEEWLDASSSSDVNTTSPQLSTEQPAPEKKVLRNCYFGLMICQGQKHILHKFNLKDREFIGNTSMDPCFSFVMSNMAQVKPGQFIFDPFVGTGSLLVAAAHCGAFVVGADLDYNLIHSRGLSSRKGQKYRRKDQTIRNNLKQYGLEDKFVDIFAADFSTAYLRADFLFDAIITDPPYGIREKAKKIGTKKQEQTATADANESTSLAESAPAAATSGSQSRHFAKRTKYMLGQIFYDLLKFASLHLVTNGRLVFWLPVHLEIDRKSLSSTEMNDFLGEFIPTSSYLDLICYSEQRLTAVTSRLLVTMQRNQVECVHHLLSNADTSSQLPINEEDQIQMLNQFRDNYFMPRKEANSCS